MSYRQFAAHGPHVPQELLHSLEEERLVFFCGAGISVGTGLPTFRGLVQDAFKHLAIQCHLECIGGQRDSVPDDPVLGAAYRRREYDKVLDILEEREGGAGRLRRFVVERLTREPANADTLALHRALLDLAQLRSGSLQDARGFRLVTTNFDDRFELAGLDRRWIEAAPRLPRPRPDQPMGVVYLHGRIETDESKRDPNRRTLVLTSADFGDAYLRDGYASRFVLELFRSFSVVFIGYGLNDPVMRYLVDAIAAESGPNGQFRGAYAFADHSGGDAIDIGAEWVAKHVTPIVYDKTCGSPHQLMRDTLVNWAREHTTGLSGRLQVALGPTTQQFIAGRDDGEPMNHLANVAWALSKPDGVIARRFAADDTEGEDRSRGPHISWLGPLLSFEILDPERAKPGSHETCRLFELPAVAHALALWIASNLEHEALISWLLEARDRPELQADIFRNALRRQIEFKLSRQPPAPPFSDFWRVIVNVLATNSEGTLWLQAPQDPSSLADCRAVLRALRPRLLWPRRSLRKALAKTAGEALEPKHIGDLADFELVLGGQHSLHLFERLQSTPDDIVKALLLDDLTSLLLEGLDLAEAADIGSARGYSHVERPSIAPHEANEEYSDWTRIFDVLVDALRAAGRVAPDLAQAGAARWRVLWQVRHQMLFARLYLFAAVEVLPSGDGANFLLEHSGLLWSAEAEFEVCEHLKTCSAKLDDNLRQTLELALLQGPARSLFGVCSEDEYAKLADQNKAQLISAMQLSGACLSSKTKEFLEEYGRRSGVVPGSSEPWARPSVSHRPSPSAAGLIGRSADDIAVATRDHRSEYGFRDDREAGELLAAVLRAQTNHTPEIFTALLDLDESRPEVWEAAFWALAQGEALMDTPASNALASILESRPLPVRLALGGYSRWLRSAADKEIDDASFWRLWDIASVHGALESRSALVETEASVDGSVNSAGGTLMEAALVRRWRSKPSRQEGLGGDVEPRLSMLVDGDSTGCRYARVAAVRWLRELFWLDPPWTQRYLLDRMKWNPQTEDTIALWRAFFFGPRGSPELVGVFKDDYLAALRFRSDLGEKPHESACKFLADIVAVDPKLFTREQAVNALRNMGAEGVSAVLERFAQLLDHSDEAGDLWRRTIGPWLTEQWPPDRELRKPGTFTAAAKLAIATKQAFPQAITTLRNINLVDKIGKSESLLFRLERHLRNSDDPLSYDYPRSHPDIFILWLDAVLPAQIDPWSKDTLRQVIAQLEAADVLDEKALGRLKDRLL